MKNIIKNIIIFAFPFNINSGGIVALYYLAKLINDTNYNNITAKIYVSRYKRNNILCNDFIDIKDISVNDSIIIYPEIIQGNPLNGKYIIRWVLGELGMNCDKNIYKTWNKTDLVYHWEPIENPNYKILNCPYINNIFINKNYKERNNTCYCIRKGRSIHKQIIFIHPNNSICIDNMKIENIVECFNKSKYFYCYDTYTFLIAYAIICGCIPIVYPLNNISKTEYINNTIMKYIKNYAIAYGNTNDEIKNAEDNLQESAKDLLNINNMNKNKIDIFTKEIFNYYNNIETVKLSTVQYEYY